MFDLVFRFVMWYSLVGAVTSIAVAVLRMFYEVQVEQQYTLSDTEILLGGAFWPVTFVTMGYELIHQLIYGEDAGD